MTTFTKDIARHDKIEIDGQDVSNAFFEFGTTNEDSEEDVSGFSVSGVDETLPGSRAQGFTGQCFYTPELYAILWPIFRDREVVEITWQPDGLVDNTREVWRGNVTVSQFSPTAARGTKRAMPFAAKAADAAGIHADVS